MHSLHRLIRRLAEAEFEFVLVGGYAGVVHGSALVTQDVDICAVLSTENIEKLRHALADLNPVHRMTVAKLPFSDVPKPGVPVADLYLETQDGVLDVLSSVLGVGAYARLRETAEMIPLFGHEVAVISLPDLITAKEALGREKDLLAAKELRAIAAKRAGR